MSFASSDDYGREGRKRKSTWMKSMAPVIGFLLLVACAVIAVILAPPLTNALRQSIDLPADLGEIVVGAIIFVTLLLVLFMFYAMLTPKKRRTTVTERELDKERQMRKAEKIATKKRKQKIAREMSKARNKK